MDLGTDCELRRFDGKSDRSWFGSSTSFPRKQQVVVNLVNFYFGVMDSWFWFGAHAWGFKSVLLRMKPFGIDACISWIQYHEFTKSMNHEIYEFMINHEIHESWTFCFRHKIHESYSLWSIIYVIYHDFSKFIKNLTTSFVGFTASFVGFAAALPVHQFLVVFEKLKTCPGLAFPLVSIALRPSWMVKLWLVSSNSTIGVKKNCCKNWPNWRPILNKNIFMNPTNNFDFCF